MANAKPYVQVASVCERVLQEQDDVVSAIRLVDKLTLHTIPVPKPPNTPPDAQPIAAVQVFDLWILVMLKSGDMVGDFRIGLRMRDPLGKSVQLTQDSPVVFKGNDGVNLKFQFGIPYNAPEGRFWFDVLWNGDVLTSIPLIVKKEESPSEEGSTKGF